MVICQTKTTVIPEVESNLTARYSHQANKA